MSEEILKALMQLFAIIAKQDNGFIENHEKYVYEFLTSQLSVDRVNEYLLIYHNFLNESKIEIDSTEPKRTSMKDSVRTLAICKKINKTLAQKQKYIVLMRLLEFFRSDVHQSANRVAIVETVSDVFKIDKEEFGILRSFINSSESDINPSELLIGDESLKDKVNCRYFVDYHDFHGLCRFILLKSANFIILKYHGDVEIHLNGIVIKSEKIYLFPAGSSLRLPKGSVYYSNIQSKFIEEANFEKFSFYTHIKEHRFKNGTKALNELKIMEESGNLIGVMGASGSGKTTLLTILSGQEKPSNGVVYINDKEIFANKEEVSGLIGYVPQDDLLIEDLTVYQNLYYNAKLCFKDIPEGELKLKLSRVLISLGLDEIKNIKVGSPLNKKISGGQRKRLNIALELIREPAILFLDEPTSGLSSRDSENVMDLLKELSLRGKLIFVVIHQPSSDIYKMFDKMFILDTGGYPTFYGNPIEGIMYFKKATNQINSEVGECYTCGSVNPETIFNLIELKEIDEFGNYTDVRKMSSSKFYDHYRELFLKNTNDNKITGKLKNSLALPAKYIQAKIFLTRDLLSKLANAQYILINLLEVPVLAVFLSLIIRYIDKSKNGEYTYYHNYNIPAYFFMSIIVALLVGLTVSAEEIYKDQKILKREKILNLSRFSYLISKVVMLFTLSLVQTIMFVTIGCLILKIHFNVFHFSLMLFSIFCFANLFGLILSSTFNSPVTIYIIIPLIIIPQMILGGAMFSFSKLSTIFGGGHKVPYVSNVMVSRWAYEGIMVDMFVNNKFERDMYKFDKNESILNYKVVYFVPKLEELLDLSDSVKINSDNLELIKSELVKDNTFIKEIGFKIDLPDFGVKKNIIAYLNEIKHFYIAKFVTITNLKESYKEQFIKKLGGQDRYDELKMQVCNGRLEEIVTESFEKEKILVEDNELKQIIDPIFKDTKSLNKVASFDAHLFAANKNLFGREIPTYMFNLIVIWFLNLIAFIVLYTDALKKIIGKLSVMEKH